MAKVKRAGSIRALEKCRRVMTDHFTDLARAASDPGRKVAWCSSVGPAELLRAMGFSVYFPENHAALLGATRTSARTIPLAVAAGYSPDVCSYMTSDIGAFIKGETPLSFLYPGVDAVPAPNVLVYNTNQCRDIKDWFTWYSRELRVPCVGVESFRSVDTAKPAHIAAIADQLRGLVPRLEQVVKSPLDEDELARVVELSRRCSELWEKVLRACENSPSPLTFFDAVVLMGPAVVARGTEAAVSFYEELLAEVNERVAAGTGAVKEERHRIYWEGMPVWGMLREQERLFRGLRVCVVASTYCNSWILSDLSPREPFESMARAYTELFIVRSEAAKEAYLDRMLRDYRVDGIIFHDAKTCPNNTNSRYGMPERLFARTNVPALTFQGDLNDLRMYSEEQTRTKLEAFVEQLEEL